MPDVVSLFLVGLIGGFFAGLLGIGGGIFFIYIIPLVLLNQGLTPALIAPFTVANSIFATMIASAFAMYSHVYKKELAIKRVVNLSLGGMLSGAFMLIFVVTQAFYTPGLFNVLVVVFLFFIAGRTYYVNFWKPKNPMNKNNIGGLKRVNSKRLFFYGLAGGGVAGLTGLGGGTIITPFLHLKEGLSLHQAKAMSIGFIFFTSLGLSLFNFFYPFEADIPLQRYNLILPGLVIPLSLGASISSIGGVALSRKISPLFLSILFIIFVLAIAFHKLFSFF